jgi:hypothetical protein
MADGLQNDLLLIGFSLSSSCQPAVYLPLLATNWLWDYVVKLASWRLDLIKCPGGSVVVGFCPATSKFVAPFGKGRGCG